MKRSLTSTLLAAAALLLAAGAASAQLPGAPVGISLGVKGGVTIATFHGDDAGDPDNRNGFAAGVQAVLHSPLFNVQVEGLYVQKGAEQDDGSVKHTYKFDYLEVPVLMRWDLPGMVVKPYLLAGPALAFNTSAKIKSEGALTKATAEVDVKDDVKDTDVGLVVGAGIANTRNHVFFEARYELGLSKTAENGNDIKNGTIMFLAGYSF